MLAVQEQKLSLEVKQAEVTLREMEHNQKIADKSIQAQADDQKDERALFKVVHFQRLVFTFLVLAMVLGFVGWALREGKDALVLDILKIILGFVGGWGASLAFANKKKPNGPDDS